MKKKINIVIGVIAAIIITIFGVGIAVSGVLNPYERQIKLGYKMITQEKYEEAILAFNKAIEINEKSYKAYIGLADAYVARCDESTVEDVNNALERGYEKSQSDKIVQGYINVAQKLYDKDKKVWSVRLLKKGYEITKSELIKAIREEYIASNNDIDFEEYERANNMANGGMVVEQGEWVYYLEKVYDKSYPKGFYAIFKDNKSGTHKQKLVNEYVTNMSISGDWLYYSVYNKGIYKIKTDGSNVQKLCDYDLGGDFSEIDTVTDDWVYYSIIDQKDHKIGKIIRIKTDGTQKSVICDDAAFDINIQNGKIFYSNVSDDNKLYSISLDGKNKKKISDDTCRCINISDNWVYYINGKSSGNIYKIKDDGSNKTKVNNESCYCLNIFKNRIYYVKLDPKDMLGKSWGLYGVDIDGGNITKYVDQTTIDQINIANGFIYYRFFSMATGANWIDKIKI